MRFGHPHAETLRDQLVVESLRLPRWLCSEVGRRALQEGVSKAECYRRLLTAGLAARPEVELDLAG